MAISRPTVYVPYGAYEMKARYQRNLLLGDLLVLGVAAAILIVSMILAPAEGPTILIKPVPNTTDRGMTAPQPPPTIIKERSGPVVSHNLPQEDFGAGPIVAISDDIPLDDESMLPTQRELREMIGTDTGFEGNGTFDTMAGAASAVDYFDEDKPFEHSEVEPEAVQLVQPEYPRMARLARITGTVIIQAIVERDGSVKEAKVLVSSKSALLDEAALKAAYKNKFKPGIQNGRPVRCAVKYPVRFDLQ
jgi:protein TonB